MTKTDYDRAVEWTILIFGERFAEACARHDWDEAERCFEIIVRRKEAFEKRLPAKA